MFGFILFFIVCLLGVGYYSIYRVILFVYYIEGVVLFYVIVGVVSFCSLVIYVLFWNFIIFVIVGLIYL